MTANKKHVKVQLVKSLSGRLPRHIACANGLGLRRINQVSVIEDTPCNRGMINKVAYLLKVTEIA